MQQCKKVSVIVPVYNVEKYLEKCIDSILSQTYTNFEIILVNDGSKDDSINICREYEKKDNRVVVIDKCNEGAAVARNAGLDVASGDYIMFVDSDDYIETEMMQHLVELIGDADIAVCNHFIENEDNGEKVIGPLSFSEISSTDNSLSARIALLDEKGKFSYLWDRLYRRNIIEDNCIRFDRSFVTSEDLDFNLKYFKHIKTIALSDSPMYHYFKHGTETLCSRFKESLYEMMMEINLRHESFYVDTKMIENEKYKRIQEKFYVDNISSCVPNMFRKDAPYTFSERVKMIDTMMKDEKLQSYIKSYTPNSKIMQIFKFCITTKNAFFAVLGYSLLFFIRNNLSGLYDRLKEN